MTQDTLEDKVIAGRKRDRSRSPDNDSLSERLISVLIRRSEENAVKAREAEWASEKLAMQQKIAELENRLSPQTSTSTSDPPLSDSLSLIKVFTQTAVDTPEFLTAWRDAQPSILEEIKNGRLAFPPPSTPTSVTFDTAPSAEDIKTRYDECQSTFENGHLAANVLGTTDIPLAQSIKAYFETQAWSHQLLIALLASYQVNGTAIKNRLLVIPQPVYDLSNNAFNQNHIWSAETMIVDALKVYRAQNPDAPSPSVIAGWVILAEDRPVVWYAILAEKRFVIQGSWIKRKSRSQYFGSLISAMFTYPSSNAQLDEEAAAHMINDWRYDASDLLDDACSLPDSYAVSLFTIDRISRQPAEAFDPNDPADIGISSFYDPDEASLKNGIAETVLRHSVDYLLGQAIKVREIAYQLHKNDVG